MKLSIIPALLVLASTCLPGAPEWKWSQDENRSVELTGPHGPVARFLVDPAPLDPHFDLLATPDGHNLVWVKPPDHVWHYGLWFSWVTINGTDFWMTKPETGRSEGRTEVVDPKVVIADDEARVSYSRLYRLPGNDEPIMRELATVVIRPPQDGLGPDVSWEFVTTALADVVLDRFPLPKKRTAKNAGYGGLSWRSAKDFEKVSFLNSAGIAGMKGHRKPAKWMNATGTIAGKAAGIALFEHPGNPGHPMSWFLVDRKLPTGQIRIVNPILLLPKPIDLKAGKQLTHRYRVVVHDGSLDAAALNKLATP